MARGRLEEERETALDKLCKLKVLTLRLVGLVHRQHVIPMMASAQVFLPLATSMTPVKVPPTHHVIPMTTINHKKVVFM